MLTFTLENPAGDIWYTDPERNWDDGAVHVLVLRPEPNVWRFRWEDIRFGGDRDYDDVVIEVRLAEARPGAPFGRPGSGR